MSKYTAEQVNKACREMMAGVDPCHLMIDDMLREYATHLAAQAEWPSEEDSARVLHSFDGSFNDGGIDYRMRLGLMRTALQSVRPPVWVVSDGLYEVAKRNLRALIINGSDDKELMLKCLEEL